MSSNKILSAIPSSGNLGIDITIALVAGGAVTTWLTLLFNRLATRREEYIELSTEKIKRISNAETVYMHINSYLIEISRFLEDKKLGNSLDYQVCIFFIARYVNEIRKFSKNVTYVQLDDIYAESAIQQLIFHLYHTLVKDLGYEMVVALTDMIGDDTTILSFMNDLSLPLSNYAERRVIFDALFAWLEKLDGRKADEISELAQCYRSLIALELNLTYRIYYGGTNYIKRYYKTNPLNLQLLKFLGDKHVHYYERLRKLGLV